MQEIIGSAKYGFNLKLREGGYPNFCKFLQVFLKFFKYTVEVRFLLYLCITINKKQNKHSDSFYNFIFLPK